jgi:hypothetical protein
MWVTIAISCEKNHLFRISKAEKGKKEKLTKQKNRLVTLQRDNFSAVDPKSGFILKFN